MVIIFRYLNILADPEAKRTQIELKKQTNKQTTILYRGHVLYKAPFLSVLSQVLTLFEPWTAAHQAPLSMGFSRQEYWSGLPCPSPGDLPDTGIKPASLVSPRSAGRFFTTSATLLDDLHIFSHDNPCQKGITFLL